MPSGHMRVSLSIDSLHEGSRTRSLEAATHAERRTSAARRTGSTTTLNGRDHQAPIVRAGRASVNRGPEARPISLAQGRCDQLDGAFHPCRRQRDIAALRRVSNSCEEPLTAESLENQYRLLRHFIRGRADRQNEREMLSIPV